CAIAAMLSQRSRVDTLVPPNFSTIHDADWIWDGAGVAGLIVESGLRGNRSGQSASLSLCSAKKQADDPGRCLRVASTVLQGGSLAARAARTRAISCTFRDRA